MFPKPGKAVAMQIASLGLAVTCVLVVSRIVPLDVVAGWMRVHVARYEPWSMICYPLVHATCNLLLLPAGVLVVGSGFLFGLWRGFLLALTGHLLSAAGAFWISRTVARGAIERHLATRPQWRALDLAVEREGWKIVFLSQLSPLLPTSLFNYCYGLTKMRFWPCMLCIAAGWSPGMFVYAYLGRMGSFGWQMWREGGRPTPSQYVVWLGGLGLSLGITISLGLLAMRLLREARARAEQGSASGLELPKVSPGAREPAVANALVEREYSR